MLCSVQEVIDALGGPAAASVLAGVGVTAVSNWKVRGSIPPENFLIFTDALERGGKPAPHPAVFKVKEPRDLAGVRG